MSKVNRRKFLSRLATGAGIAAGGTYAQAQAPVQPGLQPASARLGTLVTTSATPMLRAPNLFEDLLAAPLYDGVVTPRRVPLRMTLRGLYAVVIRRNFIDVVLMDARAHDQHSSSPLVSHVGKLTVDARYAQVPAGDDPRVVGAIEADHPEYFPVRAWDVRGSIVTFSTASKFADADRIKIVEQPDNPWSSMKWQLSFDDVFPEGIVYSSKEMEATANGAVAGIIRLEYGRLQSVIPGRRYGNTGTWEVLRAGEVRSGQARKKWRQALSDTLLYSLDLPTDDTQVTLTRRPLTGYVPEPNYPAPSYSPIVLTAPSTPGMPLPCGLAHEPPLGAAEHRMDLVHNRVFYKLYKNAPTKVEDQPVPQLVSHWADLGVGRESRSAYWQVTRGKDGVGSQMQVNVCDPNCNGAVFGLRNRLA